MTVDAGPSAAARTPSVLTRFEPLAGTTPAMSDRPSIRAHPRPAAGPNVVITGPVTKRGPTNSVALATRMLSSPTLTSVRLLEAPASSVTCHRADDSDSASRGPHRVVSRDRCRRTSPTTAPVTVRPWGGGAAGGGPGGGA